MKWECGARKIRRALVKATSWGALFDPVDLHRQLVWTGLTLSH
jgi:hypothetical protein